MLIAATGIWACHRLLYSSMTGATIHHMETKAVEHHGAMEESCRGYTLNQDP